MSMVDFQYAEFLFSDDRAARLAAAGKASIKALRLAPDHARAHLSLGPVLCVTNRGEAGIAECERALAIDPNLAAAHGAIGAFKAHIGRDEETEAHVREALRLSPRDGSVFLWLMFVGGANVNLGRYEEAIVRLTDRSRPTGIILSVIFISRGHMRCSGVWRRRAPPPELDLRSTRTLQSRASGPRRQATTPDLSPVTSSSRTPWWRPGHPRNRTSSRQSNVLPGIAVNCRFGR